MTTLPPLTKAQLEALKYLADKPEGSSLVHGKVGSNLTLRGLVAKNYLQLSHHRYYRTYTITEPGRLLLRLLERPEVKP